MFPFVPTEWITLWTLWHNWHFFLSCFWIYENKITLKRWEFIYVIICNWGVCNSVWLRYLGLNMRDNMIEFRYIFHGLGKMSSNYSFLWGISHASLIRVLVLLLRVWNYIHGITCIEPQTHTLFHKLRLNTHYGFLDVKIFLESVTLLMLGRWYSRFCYWIWYPIRSL